ncbi:MAG: MFS transporter, partial [Dehalococcoidia bacterium]
MLTCRFRRPSSDSTYRQGAPMRAIAHRLPVHYGWILVWAAVICNTVSNTATFWCVGLWIPAIADEFHVARTPVVTAFMAGQAVSAFAGPFIGRYIDRQGSRVPLLAGAVLLPGTLLFTSFAEGLGHLYLGWCVVGLTRGFSQPIPFNWLMTRWFDGRQRQSAIGIVTIGFSLGGATLLPWLASLQADTSWHTTMRLLAVMIFVVQGLTAIFFVRDRPTDLGFEPSIGKSDRGRVLIAAEDDWGFTASAALKSLPFWMLGVGLMLFFMGQGSVTNLGLDFFHSRGVQSGAAVFAASSLVRTFARLPLGATLS